MKREPDIIVLALKGTLAYDQDQVPIGDRLWTQTLPVKVISDPKLTIHASVIEVELRDSSSSMYISTGSTAVAA